MKKFLYKREIQREVSSYVICYVTWDNLKKNVVEEVLLKNNIDIPLKCCKKRINPDLEYERSISFYFFRNCNVFSDLIF